MQLAPGAIDTKGNVYVFYPESPHAYPNYDGAAMRYVVAPPNLSKWSKPVTVTGLPSSVAAAGSSLSSSKTVRKAVCCSSSP